MVIDSESFRELTSTATPHGPKKNCARAFTSSVEADLQGKEEAQGCAVARDFARHRHRKSAGRAAGFLSDKRGSSSSWCPCFDGIENLQCTRRRRDPGQCSRIENIAARPQRRSASERARLYWDASADILFSYPSRLSHFSFVPHATLALG